MAGAAPGDVLWVPQKTGPRLISFFFLLLLPDALPELVVCPSSLTSKRWQAVSESSGC